MLLHILYLAVDNKLPLCLSRVIHPNEAGTLTRFNNGTSTKCIWCQVITRFFCSL